MMDINGAVELSDKHLLPERQGKEIVIGNISTADYAIRIGKEVL